VFYIILYVYIIFRFFLIGCPFKHSEIDMLAQKLRSQHISKDNIEKVCLQVKL
jgi:hypothetical protein